MSKCPRCGKPATVESEMFCAHPFCPHPLPPKAALASERTEEEKADDALTIYEARVRAEIIPSMTEHSAATGAGDAEYIQRLVEALAPDLVASRAREAELRKVLERFIACFETFSGSLGKSTQGWDYPRLHRVRDDAVRLLVTKDGSHD